MRDDILFQELRELRTAQTALNRSLDSLAQLLTELIGLLRGPSPVACRCHAGPAAEAPPPAPPDGGELHSLKQAAGLLDRSEQVVRGWCREIEADEDAAEQRARQQHHHEMERQGVPVNRRLYLLKLPPRSVRHVAGNDKGLWEITPAGLRKLRAMNNVRLRRPCDSGDAEGEGTS